MAHKCVEGKRFIADDLLAFVLHEPVERRSRSLFGCESDVPYEPVVDLCLLPEHELLVLGHRPPADVGLEVKEAEGEAVAAEDLEGGARECKIVTFRELRVESDSQGWGKPQKGAVRYFEFIFSSFFSGT